MKDSCYFCRESQVIEKHHIVPRRYDGSDAEENLVSLCPNCHSKLEDLYDEDTIQRLIHKVEKSREESAENKEQSVEEETKYAPALVSASDPEQPFDIVTRAKFRSEVIFTPRARRDMKSVLVHELRKSGLRKGEFEVFFSDNDRLIVAVRQGLFDAQNLSVHPFNSHPQMAHVIGLYLFNDVLYPDLPESIRSQQTTWIVPGRPWEQRVKYTDSPERGRNGAADQLYQKAKESTGVSAQALNRAIDGDRLLLKYERGAPEHE